MDVMQLRAIEHEWVLSTLAAPAAEVNISSVEKHCFKQIVEADNRCLKVVFNPEEKRVITVYFDRNMRKKGCQ